MLSTHSRSLLTELCTVVVWISKIDHFWNLGSPVSSGSSLKFPPHEKSKATNLSPLNVNLFQQFAFWELLGFFFLSFLHFSFINLPSLANFHYSYFIASTNHVISSLTPFLSANFFQPYYTPPTSLLPRPMKSSLPVLEISSTFWN